MRNRLLFLAMALMLVFTLASCKGKDSELALVAVNNPIGSETVFDKLVFTHDEANRIVFKGDNGLSYWRVTRGGEADLVVFDSSLPESVIENQGVRTYTFGLEEGIEARFQIYVMPETIVGNVDDVVMIVFRFEKDNILYQKGEAFDPTGMKIYVVNRGGGVEVLRGEDVVDQFDDHGHSPLGEDGFKDQISYTVTFTHQGFSQDFEVFVSGGERPISSDDATFFDRILIIPVAYLMSVFGGLVGNSFAIAILLTTLVIRTLAWPIYAKSNDLSMKMRIVQPDTQKIQAKYATRKDPQSRQQMQMEIQQVYKKNGINLLGCFFPLLQMPIFFAMFNVVRRITLEGGMFVDSVANTMFLGVDLERGQDGITGLVLATIVGVSMIAFQQIIMMKPSYVKNTGTHNQSAKEEQTQKTMKYVSYFMAILMAVMAYNSNALAIYWIFGNAYSIVQTIINRRLSEKKYNITQQKKLMG